MASITTNSKARITDTNIHSNNFSNVADFESMQKSYLLEATITEIRPGGDYSW